MKKMLLKKLAVFTAAVICSGQVLSQAPDSTKLLSRDKKQNEKNNIIKLNVPALFFTNFSLQYERKIKQKNSFAVSVRIRPEGHLPFQKAIEDFIDAPSIKVDLFKAGQIGITPEYRFYLGKKGALHGFYLAPFINFTHYSGKVPVNYTDYDTASNTNFDKTAVFTGSANTLAAGLQAGAQWQLSERLYLDWWIAGPYYGFCTGNFVYNNFLTSDEQVSLQTELTKVQLAIPIINIDIPNPTANGASFRVSGPWLGIRAFGINLGYRF